jgi:DNA helicase TIP49 (TBP-interacting protein)
VEIEDDALELLVAKAADTSLRFIYLFNYDILLFIIKHLSRYAMQLITISSLLALKKKSEVVRKQDVNEVLSLFPDAEESSRLSKAAEDSYWKLDDNNNNDDDDDANIDKE